MAVLASPNDSLDQLQNPRPVNPGGPRYLGMVDFNSSTLVECNGRSHWYCCSRSAKGRSWKLTTSQGEAL